MTDSTTSLQHRLAVVWFTDLVGWSSLASRDEDRAIALVRRFQAAVRAAIPSDGGRVVKFIGDAALVESPSAESALRSAAALRESLDEGESVRTGVHLGDVAVAGDGDLYGDGVNTAQRIQTEAEPGQIVVSEDVARGLRSRPAFRFEPLGERRLKGVEPMELFLVVGVEAPAREEPAHSLAAEPATPSGVRARSIAVLPFANLSPDPDNEYFSDGVTEEILTALTKLGDLKVISRTSVMQYKGTTKSVRQIGAELEVGAVLEGSIRRAGNRVRITAQLIEARTDVHLWAENYDRDLDDIFAIQTDVAQRIVQALEVHLSPREKARIAERPTENVEAYQWFLKGRFFLARRTQDSIRLAIERFRKATEADPSFAQAWAGMADAFALLPSYSTEPTPDASAEARAAAERALLLDPGLGEAHAALGMTAQNEWDWEAADRELRRAIALSPGYAPGHHWHGLLLSNLGRHSEAIDALRRALALDPLSLPIHNGLGTALANARRLDEAIEIFRKAVELDSKVGSHVNLAETYDTMGRFPESLAEWEAVAAVESDILPPAIAAHLRSGFESGGPQGYWEAWIDAPTRGEKTLQMAFYIARACAQLGRIDEAFLWLDQLIEERSSWAPQIGQDPVFDPLRADPRFGDIRRRMGLA
ncbi:MAG TPA: adenylate/guanylate cyclase domain-containing protein [Gemmatimonadota bacterium]|nr:adenylate/guanylate cyclase domain-containing protein [Gemmatimonadota bacterium]